MIIGKDDEGRIILMASERGLKPVLRSKDGIWGPAKISGRELDEFTEVTDDSERHKLLAEALKQAPGRKAFSVSAYIRHGDRMLLVNHKKQGAWVPVGGEIEANETPREALVREIQEEIGWEEGKQYKVADISLNPISPEGLLAYEEHDARAKGLHMNFAFMVIANTDVVTPCDEFTETAWVEFLTDKDLIPQNVLQILHWAMAEVED